MAFDQTAAPARNAGPELLVDWLELVAFFDRFGRSRIDDLAGTKRTQQEEEPQDFGEGDQQDDLLREAIENEVKMRSTALAGAYPFALDASGEELILTVGLDRPESCLYILCLIASHVTASPILLLPPSAELVRAMRNRIFQVLGTLAVAGAVGGPAISVGYPREAKTTILEVMQRAEEWGIGISPRDKPGRHAVPQAKDGGIDVIGWPNSDRPPPREVAFGQLASGNGWQEKPVMLEYDNFMDDFFDERGGSQHTFMTIIPFRIIDEHTFYRESKKHRYVCDRSRAPLHALRALTMSGQGINIDEAQNIHQVVEWLAAYREQALA